MTYDEHIDQLAEQLVHQAEFRTEKAAEHSEDNRNADAAELLAKLAKSVRALKGTPIATMFAVIHERLGEFEDGGECHRYRHGIGFHSSPQTAEDYLIEVTRIICDAVRERAA